MFKIGSKYEEERWRLARGIRERKVFICSFKSGRKYMCYFCSNAVTGKTLATCDKVIDGGLESIVVYFVDESCYRQARMGEFG